MTLTKDEIKEIVGYAAEIIYSNEGSYGSVNKNDNGAVSIGKVQWHGSRALGLLEMICDASAEQAKNILGDKFFDEITIAAQNSWGNRFVTTAEATAISSLLITTEGRTVQDKLAEADITTYIQKGISYGLTDYGALIYFADGVNQYGTASPLWKNITLKALESTGNVRAMYEATKALTSNYIARRTKVCNAVLALDLGGEKQKEDTMEKTNLGLVVHAEKALKEGWYYLWGASAQKATQAVIDSNIRQYPDNERWRGYASKAIGKTRVCDCYGLLKSYLWWTDDTSNPKYNSAQDRNTTMAYNAATEKGSLSTMPELPGVILWMKGHVGVYIGNGRFIECMGGGVGMSKGEIMNGIIIKGSKFTHWFKDTFIDYSGSKDASTSNVYYTVKAGDNLWKIALNILGKGARYTEIMTLNGMESEVVRIGQVLKIPDEQSKSGLLQ